MMGSGGAGGAASEPGGSANSGGGAGGALGTDTSGGSTAAGGAEQPGTETSETSDATSTAPTNTQGSSETAEPTGETTDPANTDPGGPGGAGCPGMLLCDDFEGVPSGSSPDADIWSLVAGYTPVAETPLVRVGSEQAHRGSQALRVEQDGLAGIYTAVAQRQFFLRAFLRVDSAPLGPALIGIGSDTQPESEVRFRIQQNAWATLNIVPGDAVLPQAARENNCPSCPAVPVNQWFCVEIALDAQARQATLWLDGTEVAKTSDGAGDFPEMPNPIPVRLGTMSLQGGETGLWIDDVAISTTRIGCD